MLSKFWLTLWQISWTKTRYDKSRNQVWFHKGVKPLQFYVYKSTFLNKIFLLEKKPVVYKKALDSLIVLNVWVLTVLLCFFNPSQEGPAGPVASSEWEENIGWGDAHPVLPARGRLRQED